MPSVKAVSLPYVSLLAQTLQFRSNMKILVTEKSSWKTIQFTSQSHANKSNSSHISQITAWDIYSITERKGSRERFKMHMTVCELRAVAVLPWRQRLIVNLSRAYERQGGNHSTITQPYQKKNLRFSPIALFIIALLMYITNHFISHKTEICPFNMIIWCHYLQEKSSVT